MPPSVKLKRWAFVHKWTSLVCTFFLLVICVTGLPLIFTEEIERWLEPHEYAARLEGTPNASLDGMVAAARDLFPNQVVTWIYIDDEEPQTYVRMAPSFEALKADPGIERFARFDQRTAELLEQSVLLRREPPTFMSVMLRLHTDMFAGLFGELFLAFMGAMFVAAIVSGLVLYAPFMRRMEFGEVRAGRANRLKWLDLHNLIGVVTLVWALVVGATGILNELGTPLFAMWRQTELEPMLASLGNAPPPSQAELSSAESAYQTAKAAARGMKVVSMAFPGSEYATPYHYVLWAKGATPLTSRLESPVLIDARTGALTAELSMPWYLRVLELSRPLHFGDYGGPSLKTVWALLDLATIVVIGSGLYLWFGRRQRGLPAFSAATRSHTPSREAAE